MRLIHVLNLLTVTIEVPTLLLFVNGAIVLCFGSFIQIFKFALAPHALQGQPPPLQLICAQVTHIPTTLGCPTILPFAVYFFALTARRNTTSKVPATVVWRVVGYWYL